MVKYAILIKFDQRVLVTKFFLDYATYKDNTYYLFICRLSASQEENPLEFEDIINKKTYDKMRPPKPDGILLFVFRL